MGLGLFPFSNILIFESSKEFADSDDQKGLAYRVMFQGVIVIVVAFINMWITFWVEWKTKFERRTAIGYVIHLHFSNNTAIENTNLFSNMKSTKKKVYSHS